MAWSTRVLEVLAEQHNKNGDLKARWEIVRSEDGNGKHFDTCIQKTSYYMKDGEVRRGYAQAFTARDLKWLDENRGRVDAALAKKWDDEVPKSGSVEDVPF